MKENVKICAHVDMFFLLQTGPKGVVSDWREYKRLESEGRAKQMAEMDRLARKLTLTCRSHVSTLFYLLQHPVDMSYNMCGSDVFSYFMQY